MQAGDNRKSRKLRVAHGNVGWSQQKSIKIRVAHGNVGWRPPKEPKTWGSTW